ncbi:MAG: BadF/BadG/BcrA/BcrD ATPase family protein [Xanthobacteraceae bacterium]
MHGNALLLGVDGGGTQCRARLTSASGAKLGEGTGGPANIRFGLEQSFAAILDATRQCLRQAGLGNRDFSRIVACLALAGASEPTDLAAAQSYHHPFAQLLVTADAHAACIGAHRGRDGGVIVIGTGTVGWAEVNGRHHRVGGWGLPISDEGSGAWLGCEALRGVLWAHDGRIAWTDLLTALFHRFQSDPHAIVRWAAQASPRDFGSFAPLIVEHAAHDDPVAVELLRRAAAHVDALAARLVAFGAGRLALVGGLAPHVAPWLSAATERRLVPPAGDALAGALQLARTAAGSLAA